jgi:hypothetical protein
MKRLAFAGAMSLLLLAFGASPALAVGPTSVTQTGGLHVCEGTTLDVTATKTTGPSGSAFLTATGEVCGAGTTATATLSATAVETVGCITPSGSNEPKGLQTTTTTVTGSETFQTRQGRGSFTVSTNAVGIPSTFTCPSANMTPTLVSVTFTNVTLSITSQTGTITATFPDIDP